MDELFEMLSSLLGFAVSIGIVVTAVNSAKKKQQKKQAQQTLKQVKMEPTAASMKVMGTPERNPLIYEFLQRQNIRSVILSPMMAQGKIHGLLGADNPPPEKMEQKQPQGSLHYVSHEGVELHEDGFHGQNRANRTDPADVIFAESGPRVTAEQMRNALIMKEILDAPVSRRGARGRRYGR